MNIVKIDSGVEWIGKIPSDWKIERLQWHLYEINEKNDPIKTTNILSLTNKLGVVPYSEKGNQGNVAKEKFDEYKVAYPDTIVANSMNILIGSVGYCNYFGCVSPVYYVFKNLKNSNLRYWDYVFQTSQFQKELRKYANGILEIRLRVSSDSILKRKVAVPSDIEQKKIVKILDNKIYQIDKLIANEEKQIENFKQYKESLIIKVVTQGLNKDVIMKFSGVDWIGDIPSHWKISKIKYIGTTQNGISKSSEYFGHGFPFVSYSDVYRNYSLPSTIVGLIDSNEKEREAFSVKKGDIFFTRTSETIDEVGFSSVCEKTIEKACFAGFLIRLRPFEVDRVINTSFAKYFFRSNLTRRFLVKEMNLVTRASLGQELLKSMYVLLPPMKEQRQIADFLSLKCSIIDNLITIKQSKIEKLQEYKKSLIYEYVTGKKEVI